VSAPATSLYRIADGLWRSPLLDAQPWLEHAFGTAVVNPPGEWLELKQVHSARAVCADEWQAGLEADALIATTPGIRIAVKSADCLPILLADPVKHAVAAVHAGWRGCVAAIAVETVRRMAEQFGSDPANLLAAFGPSIRPCCFEVGQDVGRQFAPWLPEWAGEEPHGADWPSHADIPLASFRQLVSAGLLPDHIATQAPCTVCGGGLAPGNEFHSWRRDHQTGARMHSAIWIRD